MVIDWFYMNIVIEKVDIESVKKIVEAERLIVTIVVVHEADGQVLRVARHDNGRNWFNRVAEIDDKPDWVAEVVNKIDIHQIIGFLWRSILFVKWQIAKVESEIRYFKCWFWNYWQNHY